MRRDDGTLQQDDGTTTNGGGTFCAGDTEGGTFCARATGCGTFCAAGSTAGGTFCPAHPQGGAGAASVEMLGIRAGASRPRCVAVSTESSTDLYHTVYPMPALPKGLSPRGSFVYPVLPPIYPVARMTHGGSHC